jgi:hypothetical protein
MKSSDSDQYLIAAVMLVVVEPEKMVQKLFISDLLAGLPV